jgi:hypothetical protein
MERRIAVGLVGMDSPNKVISGREASYNTGSADTLVIRGTGRNKGALGSDNIGFLSFKDILCSSLIIGPKDRKVSRTLLKRVLGRTGSDCNLSTGKAGNLAIKVPICTRGNDKSALIVVFLV